MPNSTELTEFMNVRLDKKTMAFLHALRDEENVNVSSWVRDAIREKAARTRKPKHRKRGGYLE
jgi:hypothetical protein